MPRDPLAIPPLTPDRLVLLDDEVQGVKRLVRYKDLDRQDRKTVEWDDHSQCYVASMPF